MPQTQKPYTTPATFFFGKSVVPGTKYPCIKDGRKIEIIVSMEGDFIVIGNGQHLNAAQIRAEGSIGKLLYGFRLALKDRKLTVC